MVNRAINTTDPLEARRQRVKRVAAQATQEARRRREAAKPTVNWTERRERGEIPGLIRRAEDR